MGKPSNLKSKAPCVSSSSSCITWQGEDIDCIDICRGTSLDDVIRQLGCLLCVLKDQLDVDTYDLTCFNLSACDIPHTFRELMQFLLDLVCQLNSLILSGGGPEVVISGIPSVSVASCLQGILGNSALITDYIMEIGQLVCDQQTIIANQQAAIEQLLSRVTVLEGA